MHLFLEYTILGLVTGAVYGIAASGLVLTYTTSGIFNFAQGAMAMLAAFTYWQFRYGWNWPAPLALFVVIAVLAPLVGTILYGGIMRGLRETAEVTKIVVTIGIMLGLIALAQWIWNPGVPRTDQLFFGDAAKFQIFGVYVTDHEAIALGLRGAHRGGHPDALQEHAHRRGHAGRRGQPGAPAVERWPPGEAGRVLMGLGRRTGRAGRDPHHSDQWRHARRPRPDAAGARLHRGRHVRTAAQHLADLRRSAGPRPGRHLRARLLPQQLVLGLELPHRLADDRPLRRPHRAAPGPPARGHAAPHPGALHGPDAALGHHLGRHPSGRGPCPRADHERRRHGCAHDRDHLRDHRPVPHAAHGLRRRDQPGPSLLWCHRHHHRVPPRPDGLGNGPTDHPVGHHPRSPRHCDRRGAHRAPRPPPARPLSGPGHARLRRLRLRHDHRRHPAARAAHLPREFLDLPQRRVGSPAAKARSARLQLAENVPHGIRLHLRPARDRPHRAAPQQLRPPAHRHEGQPGGGGHLGPEPGQAEAVGLHALRGDRRPRAAFCCRPSRAA